MDKPKFNSPEELISEARIQACLHLGKKHDSLEEAIEAMPIEFWSFTMHEKDQIEKRLKKYFNESK